MKKKSIFLIISMLAIATIATNIIIVRNIPRGTPFDEYNDITRVVVFDISRNRTAYSFTLSKQNMLTIESGLLRGGTFGTYLERLIAVLRGTFLENDRDIFEVQLDYNEVSNLMYLLDNLKFYRMPRGEELPGVSSGSHSCWGVIFYFDRRHYGTLLEIRQYYTDSPDLGPLRDVVDKLIELSGANINLHPR